jgi:glycosyltransferase involved in cell wall biosynthesis
MSNLPFRDDFLSQQVTSARKDIDAICAGKRVLHCVERMHTNAIETWLARMRDHALHSGVPIDWDFHVQIPERGVLEDKYSTLEGQVIRSSYLLAEPAAFFCEFSRVCSAGRYDVVHVHADIMSAPYLIAARWAGCQKLIVHVHNADETVPTRSRVKRTVLRSAFRRICIRLAHKIVGISNHTLDTFLAGRLRRRDKDLVHYYGIDPAPFVNCQPDRGEFRRELRLPQDALILLFAGRVVPEKNPLFVVDVLAELIKREPRAVAVFVGAGSLELEVRNRAMDLGLAGSVRMLGFRADVPAVMSCCDWFILPRPEHPMEGLGIAVVEAQLAGLRMLLSRGIPDDPLLPGTVWARLSLADGSEQWATMAMQLLTQMPPANQQAAEILTKSPFDMDFALRDILSLYE